MAGSARPKIMSGRRRRRERGSNLTRVKLVAAKEGRGISKGREELEEEEV